MPEGTAGNSSIAVLASAGIPAGVMVAPVIPGLTDHEVPSILEAAGRAGARSAAYVLLRLPHGLGPMFESWLGDHFPDRKERVLARTREVRGGKLNDPRFGSRMRGEGVLAEQIAGLFAMAARRAGLADRRPGLSAEHFGVPGPKQLTLFDSF